MRRGSTFNERYFKTLIDFMRMSNLPVGMHKPSKEQFQIVYSWTGRKDIAINILKRNKEIRVDLTLKSKDAHHQYEQLRRSKRDKEQIIGRKLEWNPKPRRERQIILRLKNTNPTNEKDWPRQHAWLAARLVSFRLAFGPRIEALDA